jgi:septum formation protein
MKRIILASESKAKRELLEKLGISFEVMPSEYEEDHGLELSPKELVTLFSEGKARDVAKKVNNALVIGADTMVLIDQEMLGKAHTEEKAKEMLRKLSGRSHDVVTGLTVIDADSGKVITRFIESKIFFRRIEDWEIDYYFKIDNPINCAGAYRIQHLGQIFVEKTEGDISNVIGFPLGEFIKILREFGVSIENEI